MRSQRFYAENFSSVMSTEQKIHAEFFSGDSGPVRSFACDKRVDSLLRNAIDLRSRCASHYAHGANLLRAKLERLHRRTQALAESANQVTRRDRRPHFQ